MLAGPGQLLAWQATLGNAVVVQMVRGGENPLPASAEGRSPVLDVVDYPMTPGPPISGSFSGSVREQVAHMVETKVPANLMNAYAGDMSDLLAKQIHFEAIREMIDGGWGMPQTEYAVIALG